MASKETLNLKNAVLLTRILNELHEANEKLDLLINLNRKLLKTKEDFLQKEGKPMPDLNLAPDVVALLSLPMSLRKTLIVLYKLEKATAKEIAMETKRLRPVESASANQLVRLGYLKKKRVGRDVYFCITSSKEAKE